MPSTDLSLLVARPLMCPSAKCALSTSSVHFQSSANIRVRGWYKKQPTSLTHIQKKFLQRVPDQPETCLFCRRAGCSHQQPHRTTGATTHRGPQPNRGDKDEPPKKGIRSQDIQKERYGVIRFRRISIPGYVVFVAPRSRGGWLTRAGGQHPSRSPPLHQGSPTRRPPRLADWSCAALAEENRLTT